MTHVPTGSIDEELARARVAEEIYAETRTTPPTGAVVEVPSSLEDDVAVLRDVVMMLLADVDVRRELVSVVAAALQEGGEK